MKKESEYAWNLVTEFRMIHASLKRATNPRPRDVFHSRPKLNNLIDVHELLRDKRKRVIRRVVKRVVQRRTVANVRSTGTPVISR